MTALHFLYTFALLFVLLFFEQTILQIFVKILFGSFSLAISINWLSEKTNGCKGRGMERAVLLISFSKASSSPSGHITIKSISELFVCVLFAYEPNSSRIYSFDFIALLKLLSMTARFLSFKISFLRSNSASNIRG